MLSLSLVYKDIYREKENRKEEMLTEKSRKLTVFSKQKYIILRVKTSDFKVSLTGPCPYSIYDFQ